MGKTHDQAPRTGARGSSRALSAAAPGPVACADPASGCASDGLPGSAESFEAVGARALPSRFSLQRAAASTPGHAAQPVPAPARAGDAIRAELGPLLEEPGEIRWEGAIFERVSSIEQQLGDLEERLGKRIPEVEERLLHLLELRLLRFERDLDTSLAGLSEHISRVGEGRRFWLGLSLAGTGLLLLLVLYLVVRLV